MDQANKSPKVAHRSSSTGANNSPKVAHRSSLRDWLGIGAALRNMNARSVARRPVTNCPEHTSCMAIISDNSREELFSSSASAVVLSKTGCAPAALSKTGPCGEQRQRNVQNVDPALPSLLHDEDVNDIISGKLSVRGSPVRAEAAEKRERDDSCSDDNDDFIVPEPLVPPEEYSADAAKPTQYNWRLVVLLAFSGFMSAAVGCVAYAVTGLPGVWGIGLESLNALMSKQLHKDQWKDKVSGDYEDLGSSDLQTAGIFLVLKMVAVAICIASNGPGGVLMPTLIIGCGHTPLYGKLAQG